MLPYQLCPVLENRPWFMPAFYPVHSFQVTFVLVATGVSTQGFVLVKTGSLPLQPCLQPSNLLLSHFSLFFTSDSPLLSIKPLTYALPEPSKKYAPRGRETQAL
jgi:hypothetical protein